MRRILLVLSVAVMMLILYIAPAFGASTSTVKGSNMPTTQPCETSAQEANDGGGRASFEEKKGGKWCYRQLP